MNLDPSFPPLRRGMPLVKRKFPREGKSEGEGVRVSGIDYL